MRAVPGPCRLFLISALILLCGTAAVSAASISGNTVAVTNSLDAAALVYVSGYEVVPEVLYPGETGTVTIHVTNAANTSVSVSQPNLIEPNIRVMNQGAFTTATSLGPGETYDYHFVIAAGNTDGTYFPLFTTSTTIYGARAINSQIKVKVDSTDLRAGIALKPDTFALSTKDRVNISVVNPRSGDLTNVLVVPEADGEVISPDEAFVGTLKAGTSAQVSFAITPQKESDVTFHVTYYNGDNKHTKEVVLPIILGKNKKGAEIVVNNIQSSGSDGMITLKGDVTNNGLTDARSVIVTAGSPATPVNPNPVYAIGNLEPDDFSSFEVTYMQTGPGTVPIVVEFKDADGNVFTERFTVTESGSGDATGAARSPGSQYASQAPAGSAVNRRGGGMFGSFGSGFDQIPVTEIAVVCAALIAILIAWKKGLLKRLTDKFRKKPGLEEELQEQ